MVDHWAVITCNEDRVPFELRSSGFLISFTVTLVTVQG